MAARKEDRTLVIDGNLVRLQRIVIEREVKTSDFIAEIARSQPLDTGILPQGCVLMSRRTDEQNRCITVYVIERPPCLQAVKYKPDKQADKIDELHLSWPGTIWFAHCVGDCLQELYLTAATTPIAVDEKDTKLCQLPMPNIYDFGNGAVCVGNLVVKEQFTVAAKVDALIDQVLHSLWNADLLPEFTDTGVESLADWAAKSTADPAFAEKMTFKPHKYETVAAMVAHLLEDSK